jgi:hypothetical protein
MHLHILLHPCPRPCVTFSKKLFHFAARSFTHTLNYQTGRTPLVGCPRLLIQYIRSHPPYLEVRNLSTRHAVGTRELINSDWVILTGLNWLGIGTSGWHL